MYYQSISNRLFCRGWLVFLIGCLIACKEVAQSPNFVDETHEIVSSPCHYGAWKLSPCFAWDPHPSSLGQNDANPKNTILMSTFFILSPPLSARWEPPRVHRAISSASGVPLAANEFNEAVEPVVTPEPTIAPKKARVIIPKGFKDVPTVTEEDNFSEMPTLALNAQLEKYRIRRNSGSMGEWEKGVKRVVCGKFGTDIDEKVLDCAQLHKKRPLWDFGDPLKVSWKGNAKGKPGVGYWTLVSVFSSKLNAGQSCDDSCREVWLDEKTKIIWSDILTTTDNWCRASGNAEVDDIGNYCNDTDIQPSFPVAQSWCAERGPTALQEAAGSGEDWSKAKYHDAKGGMGKRSKVPLRWRLPTVMDYKKAEVTGIRYVLPGLGSEVSSFEWTGSVYTAYRTFAWLYNRTDGTTANYNRDHAYAVRCMGY